MDTLIVHPTDATTKFLEGTYKAISSKQLIQGGKRKSELLKLMTKHPRCLMMGHGSPFGLLSVGQFDAHTPYIIDENTVPYLSLRNDNVFIWCHADAFVNKFHLKGFYTGMFISEELEAFTFGFEDATKEQIEESNNFFSKCFSDNYSPDVHKMHAGIKRDYGILTKHNPIARYNWERLYVN